MVGRVREDLYDKKMTQINDKKMTQFRAGKMYVLELRRLACISRSCISLLSSCI